MTHPLGRQRREGRTQMGGRLRPLSRRAGGTADVLEQVRPGVGAGGTGRSATLQITLGGRERLQGIS